LCTPLWKVVLELHALLSPLDPISRVFGAHYQRGNLQPMPTGWIRQSDSAEYRMTHTWICQGSSHANGANGGCDLGLDWHISQGSQSGNLPARAPHVCSMRRNWGEGNRLPARAGHASGDACKCLMRLRVKGQTLGQHGRLRHVEALDTGRHVPLVMPNPQPRWEDVCWHSRRS